MQPRHRFMSAYEQRVEPPDKNYQYLLFACEPYETIGFKVPNDAVDKGEDRFFTNWDVVGKKFTLSPVRGRRFAEDYAGAWFGGREAPGGPALRHEVLRIS